MKEKFTPNHLHLLVRGYIFNPPKDVKSVDNFLIDLVQKVRMKVVAGPTSVYVDDYGNEGATGTITLATSHAAIHFWDSEIPSLFQFDIYSCTEFTIEEVLNCINEHFKLKTADYVFIDRNKDIISVIKKGNY